MKHRMCRALDESVGLNCVRLPSYYRRYLNLIQRDLQQHYQLTGTWPDPTQILTRIQSYNLKSGNGMTMEDVKDGLQFLHESREAFALDDYVFGSKKDHSDLAPRMLLWAECIGVPAPAETVVEEKEDLERVARIVAQLPEGMQMLLRRRFGLSGEEAMTLEELGKELGLGRETVRQIEVGAISKIRRAYHRTLKIPTDHSF
jgi:RNA polymerase sigma factor (sigma-70 family)